MDLLKCQKFFLLMMTCALWSCTQAPKYPGPLSPEESMKTFEFSDSFAVELYAAEPLVQDPVSMVFDEEGNAFVMEMADANMPDSSKGQGQIVWLKDLDGDGKADTSIVFASGIKEATTLLPWKGGLIVTAAPHILYFKDTDGDGKADKKEILFSGFFTGNDEAQISSLCFGVDNWIYADNTGFPGKVVSHMSPDSDTLNLQGADFRFRMDTKEFERTTGSGQYGLALDDWGNRYFTKNSIHITGAVVPMRYVERNPYLNTKGLSFTKNISDHDPKMFQISETPYWREERTNRRNAKAKEAGKQPNEFAREHFTGASGGTFYGGDTYGEEYYGNIFVGEVAGNLIHRDVLVESSDAEDPLYSASRAKIEDEKEFLASKDTWFRPANFELGPDGNLYVVDMYRQHIETPVSIPDDLAADMDFARGSDRGRIYRIVKKGSQQKHSLFDLKSMSSGELVKQLTNPNRWWRLNAQRILLERQDKSILEEVKNLIKNAGLAQARLHAVYVLEGLGELNRDIVRDILKDEESGIRKNGAILAENYEQPLEELKDLVKDTSNKVVFQAVLSLGNFQGEEISDLLFSVLKKYGTSPWFRTAILTSDAGTSEYMLEKIKADGNLMKTQWINEFIEKLLEIKKNKEIA